MRTRRTVALIGLIAAIVATSPALGRLRAASPALGRLRAASPTLGRLSAASPALGRLSAAAQAADTLPAKLTDQEFWRLSEDLSEPNGSFRSDNLVSNEIWLQWVIPDLLTRSRQSSVYLGVGPEQNFTYIAALKPKMVFITDIRRGNLHMHLMYKALFEMTSNRADFVAMLFNKKRPAGLTDKSTANEIISAYWNIPTSSEAEYKANLKAIQDHLTKTHALPLAKDDLDGIEYVYWSFYWFGPAINYSSSTNAGNGRAMVSYGDLMMATDGSNINRSYLSSEETFKVLKDLHHKNLFVPVVGNFGGPKALRAVGKYVRDHNATVAAMYLSNVEQYLQQDGIWGLFCANVASMPLDDKSTFIRSFQGGSGGGGSGLTNGLGSMLNETRACAGRSSAPLVR